MKSSRYTLYPLALALSWMPLAINSAEHEEKPQLPALSAEVKGDIVIAAAKTQSMKQRRNLNVDIAAAVGKKESKESRDMLFVDIIQTDAKKQNTQQKKKLNTEIEVFKENRKNPNESIQENALEFQRLSKELSQKRSVLRKQFEHAKNNTRKTFYAYVSTVAQQPNQKELLIDIQKRVKSTQSTYTIRMKQFQSYLATMVREAKVKKQNELKKAGDESWGGFLSQYMSSELSTQEAVQNHFKGDGSEDSKQKIAFLIALAQKTIGEEVTTKHVFTGSLLEQIVNTAHKIQETDLGDATTSCQQSILDLQGSMEDAKQSRLKALQEQEIEKIIDTFNQLQKQLKQEKDATATLEEASQETELQKSTIKLGIKNVIAAHRALNNSDLSDQDTIKVTFGSRKNIQRREDHISEELISIFTSQDAEKPLTHEEEKEEEAE